MDENTQEKVFDRADEILCNIGDTYGYQKVYEIHLENWIDGIFDEDHIEEIKAELQRATCDGFIWK